MIYRKIIQSQHCLPWLSNMVCLYSWARLVTQSRRNSSLSFFLCVNFFSWWHWGFSFQPVYNTEDYLMDRIKCFGVLCKIIKIKSVLLYIFNDRGKTAHTHIYSLLPYFFSSFSLCSLFSLIILFPTDWPSLWCCLRSLRIGLGGERSCYSLPECTGGSHDATA